MDQNRRETILSAALQAIHEVGPGRVRMEQVARLAGVSVSVIYRYFRSKDELLSVALQRPFSSRDDMADTRREEIRATALQLFGRKGFRATTMVEIGEALQISPGAIYRWFSSKEEILDAILAELLVCNPVPQRSEEKDGLLGGDLVEGLHRMARRVFTEFRAKKDLWRFILADGINNDVAATFIHKELFLRSADLLRSTLNPTAPAGICGRSIPISPPGRS